MFKIPKNNKCPKCGNIINFEYIPCLNLALFECFKCGCKGNIELEGAKNEHKIRG